MGPRKLRGGPHHDQRRARYQRHMAGEPNKSTSVALANAFRSSMAFDRRLTWSSTLLTMAIAFGIRFSHGGAATSVRWVTCGTRNAGSGCACHNHSSSERPSTSLRHLGTARTPIVAFVTGSQLYRQRGPSNCRSSGSGRKMLSMASGRTLSGSLDIRTRPHVCSNGGHGVVTRTSKRPLIMAISGA